MNISKIKTISEANGKTLLDMTIKLEYSPAEALIIQEALRNLPENITSNETLEILTNDQVAQIHFTVDTKEISEGAITQLINVWLNELNLSLEEKKHLLPLMDEVLRLKKEINEINKKIKNLENENFLIKEALIKKKIIKEEF
ncbi:MAG: hypothetical protein N2323_04400 [candidate division WOR-3 bacterium]|nr:hypothetical protein [candidate division WOR-3 bacterium]MCX7837182.1 hypothetical protein [candidate division WOR-3 bacterium]MDW8114462.1 hypothetical protein [candidate division WOR-3 bacterium]